jgi:hypothetical protein
MELFKSFKPLPQGEKPAVLLSYADYGQVPERRLRNPSEEIKAIEEILNPFVDQDELSLSLIPSVTQDNIFKTFSRKQFQDKTLIFHFAGHAGGFQLLLQTERGNIQRSGTGLIDFLARQKNLSLVFLNGCLTEQMAWELIKKGVPHVVFTEDSIHDEAAKNFAIRFYSSLAAGKDIASAFDDADNALSDQAVNSDFRTLQWPDLEDEIKDPDHKPWKLLSTLDLAKSIVQNDWESAALRLSGGLSRLDGIIQFYKNSKQTGKTLFFVAEHFRIRQANQPKKEFIELPFPDLETRRKQWLAQPLPVILFAYLYFHDEPGAKALWVDLRSNDSYSDNRKNLLIPLSNTFKTTTKGALMRLCGKGPSGPVSHRLTLDFTDTKYLRGLGKFKSSARKFYVGWAHDSVAERTHPVLGEILVSRVGWKHICRPNRKKERILQSWLLLSAAKKIILNVDEWHALGRSRTRMVSNKIRQTIDFLGLRAEVHFNFRDSSLVQVILRRSQEYNTETQSFGQKIWFYSVYEMRRED